MLLDIGAGDFKNNNNARKMNLSSVILEILDADLTDIEKHRLIYSLSNDKAYIDLHLRDLESRKMISLKRQYHVNKEGIINRIYSDIKITELGKKIYEEY